jgi:hypothetical protein
MQPQDQNPPEPQNFPQQPLPGQPGYDPSANEQPAQPNQPFQNQPMTQPLPPAPNQPQPTQQPPQPNIPQPTAENPQAMYYSRPLDPQRPNISPEIQKLHEDSKKKYPGLNLSEGEFVISSVKRHPIGLLGVWLTAGVLILAIIGLMTFFASNSDSFGSRPISTPALGLAAILLTTLVAIGAYIVAYVYNANKFYLTNESVIQNIQMSLFSNREQTVSLGNIEDASYLKQGIIQTMFDYGTVRLSTQGDETTYRFTFASDPEGYVAKLNNAVESFKNGRPVYDDDDPGHGRAHH